MYIAFIFFVTTKLFTGNFFFFSENILKLTYDNVELQKFSSVKPPDPRFKGGEGV